MRESEYYNHGLFRGLAKKAELPKELRKGFPTLTRFQTADFLAGYIEECGYFSALRDQLLPTFIVIDDDEAMLEGIVAFTGIEPTERQVNRYIKFEGLNALDALGAIYSLSPFGAPAKRATYFGWMQKPKKTTQELVLQYKLNHKDAQPPSKARSTDSGYDLTLIEKIKENEHGVEFYTTGVAVSPPFGYYFNLVGRSSITKTGYTLANNVGIIDRGYSGDIIVPLIKISNNAHLELPAKIVQIVPNLALHFFPVKVQSLVDTARSSGSFGSTNETKEPVDGEEAGT
jgi:dUTP pyrophosphatase